MNCNDYVIFEQAYIFCIIVYNRAKFYRWSARPRRVWIEMDRNISRNLYHFEGCYSYRRMWTRKIACGGALIKYLLQLSIEYMSITNIIQTAIKYSPEQLVNCIHNSCAWPHFHYLHFLSWVTTTFTQSFECFRYFSQRWSKCPQKSDN